MQTKIKVVNAADTSIMQDTSQILDTSAVNDGDIIDLRRPSLLLGKPLNLPQNLFGAGGAFDASASPSSSPPSRSAPIAPPTPNLGANHQSSTAFSSNLFPSDSKNNSFTNEDKQQQAQVQ